MSNKLKGSSKYLNFCKFRETFENVKVEENPNNVLDVIESPTISILLVTYQHVDYIEKAINSILTQETKYSYEIILGDDESTDGTREICLDYANKYPDKIRFFLHKRENNIRVGGSPSILFQYAYNLFSCRGKYVAMLSGDDFWTDRLKLQKQVEYLEVNPQHSMVCTNYSIVNEKNKVIREDGWGKEIENGSIDHLTILKDYKPKTQTTLTRCSAIPEKLPTEFFQCLNEDNFFCALVSEKNDVGYMDYVSTAYRVHSTALWSSVNETEQKKMQLNTYLNMSKVFVSKEQKKAINARIGNIRRKLSLAYAEDGELLKAYKEAFKIFTHGRIIFLKHFLRLNFRIINIYS